MTSPPTRPLTPSDLARQRTCRTVPDATPTAYSISMVNDFLTPRGAPYKSQRLNGEFSRHVAASVAGVASARYEWGSVSCRTTDESGTRELPWTFAEGASFRSILLNAQTEGQVSDAVTDPPLPHIDVTYPDLPQVPAVALLTLMGWDIVTFEFLCSQVVGHPDLPGPGTHTALEGISHTWATLDLPGVSPSSVFRNGTLACEWVGVGPVDGRECAIHSFECLDGELEVESAVTPQRVQRGGSAFSGHVYADLETGDLRRADMTETLLATVSGYAGGYRSVRKRRRIRLQCRTTHRGSPPSSEVPNTSRVVSPPPIPGLAALVRHCASSARRYELFLREHVVSLDDLPHGLGPVARMGFRSMTGRTVEEQLRRASLLRSILSTLLSSEDSASVPDDLGTYGPELRGFLSYTKLAADEARRLHLRDEPTLATLHQRMDRARGDVETLISGLYQLTAAPADGEER